MFWCTLKTNHNMKLPLTNYATFYDLMWIDRKLKQIQNNNYNKNK